MRNFLVRMLATLGTFAGAVALVFSLRDPADDFTPWQIVLLTFLIGSGLLALAMDVLEYASSRPVTTSSPLETKQYMHTWLSKGATAAIFTRGLGWAEEDPDIAALLEERARGRALTIVMPQETRFSERLRGLGASVHYYPHIDYTIMTRFTILDVDRNDARVAIGRAKGFGLSIEEHQDGIVLSLARDVFELSRRLIERSERQP